MTNLKFQIADLKFLKMSPVAQFEEDDRILSRLFRHSSFELLAL